MREGIVRAAIIASASLICGCDNIVPSAESVVLNPSIFVTTDIATGDRLICVGAMADGPCTPSSAQAVISGAAELDSISARWAGKGKVIVSVGSGKLEKSSETAMDGSVIIEYQ